MLRFLKTATSHRLVRANIVMVGGSFAASVGAYLYHLLMGRMLIPEDYGALQSLISLSNILTVPLVTMNAVIVRFVSMLVGRGEGDLVTYIHHRLSRLFWWTFAIGGSTFLALRTLILQFLHLTSVVHIVFLDVALFFGLLQMLNRSILQGLSRFVDFVGANLLESWGKMLLGVFLVALGTRVEGAFGAFVVAGALTYIFTELKLRQVLTKREAKAQIPRQSLLRQGLEGFVMTVSMMSLFNTDVVLVRHFLSAREAGLYGALSVLGKIIYFGSAPVANTMLPMVSESHARGDKFQKIFLMSFGLTATLVGVAAAVFGMFPESVMSILIGKQYIDAAPLLLSFAMFISLCALINVVALYFFSTHQIIPLYFMPIGAILQAVLISVSHGSLLEVIRISLSVTASLLVALLLYYAYVAGSKASLRYRPGISAGTNH